MAILQQRVGYAVVLPTQPAFSFGSRNDRAIRDPGPGPGAYDASLQYSARGGGFGSGGRYTPAAASGPGPQEYAPSSSDLRKSAAYTFRTKSQPDHLKSKTPGPGTYQPGPGKDQVSTSSPAISIGHRYHDRAGERRPGPGEYHPDYQNKEHPGASIKFRHPVSAHSDAPGPGQYPVDRAYSSPPGKSFGTSRPQNHLDGGTPGPIYSVDPGYECVKPRRTAWSMSKSPRDHRLDNGVPGPGTYGLHAPVVDRPAGHGLRSEQRSTPAYTMSGKPYTSPPGGIPGPSDYGIPKEMRKSAPAFTLHGADTKDSRRNYPGPGTYQAEQCYSAVRPGAPAVSMGVRPPDRYPERRPGPNEYNPQYRVKEQPGVSIKFRHSRDNSNITPAPHDYADKDFVCIYSTGKRKKGYTFGVRHKEYTTAAVPGPHYKVGCSTLGIAAAKPIPVEQLPLTVVL